MAASVVLHHDEYYLKVRERVDALRSRLTLLPLSDARTKQDEVLSYFVDRAAQIGEACFKIYDLEVPLAIQVRVLCEDLFTMYWASLSDANAEELQRNSLSRNLDLLRRQVKNGRAKLRSKSTGADVTATAMAQFPAPRRKKTVEALAGELGLSKLYDLVYCSSSLEVHGNDYRTAERKSSLDYAAVSASSVACLLKVMLMIVDTRPSVLSAEEILRAIGLHRLQGD